MQLSDYKLAKQTVNELEVHKEIIVTPDKDGNFRKYMRDVQGEKEFITRKTTEGLKVTRLK